VHTLQLAHSCDQWSESFVERRRQLLTHFRRDELLKRGLYLGQKRPARATAALSPARDCIYVMDPAGADALSMSGTPNLISACGVYINSNNATALHGNGTPTLTASEIDIVGGYSFAGTMNPSPLSTGVATYAGVLIMQAF
jgi:hypothetical protein